MEKLPFDVLSNIFMRLLAKQLAQMRCICKNWNILLSESSFVKAHLQYSINNNNEILLFFRRRLSFDSRSITARNTRSLDLDLTNFIEFPVNPQSLNVLLSKDIFSEVIGSVNGLICFYNTSYSLCFRDCVVYIWNPSLSAVLTLPPCSLPSDDVLENHYRFGYDPKTNDYKLVRLTTLFGPDCNVLPEVEVYSMRKGSWELATQRFPSHITMIMNGDCVCADGRDGRFHWLGSSGSKWNPQTIVAFDLGAETFHEIPLPHSILHHHGVRSHVLKVLFGKLCLMSKDRNGCEWEVWVMNEYGVAESWVKHHVLPQFGSKIDPYGFTSNNEFLFRDVDGFGLYDPVAAQTKTFKMMNTLYGINTIVEYVDSLVWIIPTKHELSKEHLSNPILKSHQVVEGLQKARKHISRLLFQRCISCLKGH